MLPVLLIFFYLFLITPLQLAVVIGKEAHFPRGAVGVMIWGIPYTVHFIGRRDEKGKFYIKTTLPGNKAEKDRPLTPPSPALLQILKAFRASKGAWHLLKKGVHIRSGSFELILGGENAALLALLTAALQAIFSLSRRFSLRVHPSFQGKSDFRFRCIVETRLGTLLAAGMLGEFYALGTGKKEENAWIIPSET